MSRQSKNAKRLAKAREISKLHKDGGKGPTRTEPKHGKRWTYRHNPAVQKALAEALKASAPKQEKTSGKAILAKAGSASADQD
jgi:hypothetical protein